MNRDLKLLDNVEILDINADNVDERGFFCMRSKPKAEGYQRKLGWLKKRFSEDMKFKILQEKGRHIGFIEYISGEYTWRAVNAKDYMVIHCLWLVGKGKGKGYGSQLLNICIQDAKEANKHGVVMITSEETYLASSGYFLKQGFELVDEAPPSFKLVVKKFGDHPAPSFKGGWNRKLRKYGSGLTILYADQCPYNEKYVASLLAAAKKLKIEAKAIEVKTRRQAQASPSPYGVFNVIYNGELLCYHPLSDDEFKQRLKEMQNQ